jgi:hypothetical protein
MCSLRRTRTRSHSVGRSLTRKAPSGRSEGAFELGAAYRNRTDDLFITREDRPCADHQLLRLSPGHIVSGCPWESIDVRADCHAVGHAPAGVGRT